MHCAFEGGLTTTGVPPNLQPGIQVLKHPQGAPAIPQEMKEENLKKKKPKGQQHLMKGKTSKRWTRDGQEMDKIQGAYSRATSMQ